MSNSVKGIYHTARCGSTLLGSLLSTVSTCYLEPQFAFNMARTGKITDDHNNSIIKFPSLVLMDPVLLNDKKVFLYRPLLQHLYKIKSVESIWLKDRTMIIRDKIKQKNLFEGLWEPKTPMETIAYQWLVSVQEINKHNNVMWIQTNDFLKNKEKTIHNVCNFFQIKQVTDFTLTKFNIKKIKINGKNTPCSFVLNETLETVNETHGIVYNEECEKDIELVDIVNNLKSLFPYNKNKFI